MKPLMDRIKEDFYRVKGQANGSGYHSSEFEPRTYTSSSYTKLYSDVGITAQLEYTHFVVSEAFPSDGSWLYYEPVEKSIESAKAAKKISKAFLDILSQTNFFNVLHELVTHGVEQNMGLMEVSYANGLSFRAVDPYCVYYSHDTNEGVKRVYTETEKTGADILAEFEGEAVDIMMAEEKALTGWYKVVEAIVPINKYFFEGKLNKKFKYKKVYLLDTQMEEYMEVTKKGKAEEAMLYRTFPLMKYNPSTPLSLTEIAEKADRSYCNIDELITEKAKENLNPRMVADKSQILDGRFHLGIGNAVGVSQGEVQPQVLQATGNFNLSIADLQKEERKLNRIFKHDLIQRVNYVHTASFEKAEILLNAIKGIMPHAHDLINRTAKEAVNRAASLLMTRNKEFKQLVAEVEGEFNANGILEKMARLEKAASVARMVQGLAGIAGLKPQDSLRINGDELYKKQAMVWGCEDVLHTDTELKNKKQALAKQQQIQQQTEQAHVEAQTANQAAQAEKAQQGE